MPAIVAKMQSLRRKSWNEENIRTTDTERSSKSSDTSSYGFKLMLRFSFAGVSGAESCRRWVTVNDYSEKLNALISLKILRDPATVWLR
jgi:hypothetical protein